MQFLVNLVRNSEGDIVVDIPDFIVEQLDWLEGDSLVVQDNPDGTLTISKVKPNE